MKWQSESFRSLKGNMSLPEVGSVMEKQIKHIQYRLSSASWTFTIFPWNRIPLGCQGSTVPFAKQHRVENYISRIV
jgi:hypothetical protein